ncbi:MAG TPA: hypothetical protein VFU49_24515 [Ktedonobacteraceae bacterium]|nr:hypothetical protein [Ktedonobacteraceae bacterium]
MRKSLPSFIVVLIVSSALCWGSNMLGGWWGTVLVGLGLGLFINSQRGLLLAILAGGCGWAIPLAYRTDLFSLIHIGAVVASMIGIGSGYGWGVIGGTVLLGVLLCGAGYWSGSALHAMLPLHRFPAYRQANKKDQEPSRLQATNLHEQALPD